jgi:hypothetical protein
LYCNLGITFIIFDRNPKKYKCINLFFMKVSDGSSSGSRTTNYEPFSYENMVSHGFFQSQKENHCQEFDTTTLERDSRLHS